MKNKMIKITFEHFWPTKRFIFCLDDWADLPPYDNDDPKRNCDVRVALAKLAMAAAMPHVPVNRILKSSLFCELVIKTQDGEIWEFGT